MIDRLYPAKWDPDGAEDSGLLYCHGDDYAFWIDPDAEDWWGVELAKAINDAHDLRDQVQRLRAALDRAWEWSAKYPLQGAPSEADRNAANDVYQIVTKALEVTL